MRFFRWVCRRAQRIEAAICAALRAAGGQPIAVPFVRSAEQADAGLRGAGIAEVGGPERALP